MEKGFQKIDFAQKNDKIASAPMNRRTPRAKNGKKFRISLKSRRAKIIAGVLAVLVLFFVLVGVQGFFTVQQAQRTEAQARLAMDQLKTQNIELAQKELVKTRTEVTSLKKNVDGMFYLGYIPGIHWYYNDARHGVNAAGYGLDAAITTTETLIPHADLLGLKGEGTFSGGSAQDRIRLAVQALDKIVPEIDKIDDNLVKAEEELSQIDSGHYPNFWKFAQIKTQIEQAQAMAGEGSEFVQNGKPLIKLLPELLGAGEDKKYLILLQNDKELRPTGGFLTFYAVFRVEEGVLNVETSGDIYDLDNSISPHPRAPELIREYLDESQWFIRNSNISPDFRVSMDDFMSMYEESSAPQDIDGIIAVDTHFFVNALNVLGSVEAGGFTFNTDIDERCDCPQAVYILEDQVTRPVGYVRENRKSLLADLMQALMQKALQSSPSQYWGPLFQQALSDAQQKHVIMYLFDDDAQQGLEALNWAGRIRDFEGDYLHINDANFGGQKSNMYVTKSVVVDYNVADDGQVNKKVHIEYKNPYPHSDCDLESGGLCLNATLRNLQRIYVPEGSALKDSIGSQVTVDTKEGLGKSYFEGFLTVSPQGKAEIEYEYTLPFKLDRDSTLPVLIQKQPGLAGDMYEIRVNGNKVEEFDLITDKELNLEVF